MSRRGLQRRGTVMSFWHTGSGNVAGRAACTYIRWLPALRMSSPARRRVPAGCHHPRHLSCLVLPPDRLLSRLGHCRLPPFPRLAGLHLLYQCRCSLCRFLDVPAGYRRRNRQHRRRPWRRRRRRRRRQRRRPRRRHCQLQLLRLPYLLSHCRLLGCRWLRQPLAGGVSRRRRVKRLVAGAPPPMPLTPRHRQPQQPRRGRHRRPRARLGQRGRRRWRCRARRRRCRRPVGWRRR